MLRVAKELNRVPLFAGLSEKQCMDMASFALIRNAAKGEYFFKPGATGDGLHIILKGRVKLVRLLPGDREAMLAVLGPGEWFGEELVLGNENRETGAVALEATDYAILPGQELVERIKSNARLSMDILSSLCGKLQEYANCIVMLRECDICQRLARYLHDCGARCDADGFFCLEMPKYVLAGYLGAARESVSRCFKSMVESRLIEMRGRRVRILDKNGLLSLASLGTVFK